MKLIEIAAIGKNRELGKDNGMIWHMPKDLKFFKEQTKGHSMVMGRKTFESLPGMLPGRHHIVISRSKKDFGNDVEVFASIEEFMQAYQTKDETVFVIGGGQIYTQMLDLCDELILTHVDASCDSAQVFFPEWKQEDYERHVLLEQEDHGMKLSHVRYVKK